MAAAATLSTVVAVPLIQEHASSLPVAIWHGLGDRYVSVATMAWRTYIHQIDRSICSYDSPGLADLADDIRDVLGPSTFVYMIRTNNDSNADQKETLFGSMDSMLSRVAEQLRELKDFKDGFDAIGLSQGGVFLRGYVERYGSQDGYPKVRNLITLGSPYVHLFRSFRRLLTRVSPKSLVTWASHRHPHASLQTSSARLRNGPCELECGLPTLRVE